MNYKDIYNEYDIKYREINNDIFQKFIEEFRRKSGLDERRILKFFGVSQDNPDDVFNFLLNYILDYDPKYIELFYQILKEFNYNMAIQIISLMNVLGTRGIVGEVPKDIYSFMTESPLINEITNHQGIITFSTNLFSDISFCSTSKYFENNLDASKFLLKSSVGGQCHKISWELLDFLENASLVTALIPNYFVGTYYHTIIRNQDGMFVDGAMSIAYDEDVFNNLYKGKILVETKKQDIMDAYQEALKDGAPIDFAPPLVLALHKQKQTLGR